MSVTVSGIMINPVGEPVANAQITLTAIANSLTVLNAFSATVRTDNIGAYRIQLEEGSYSITVAANGRSFVYGAVTLDNTTGPSTLNQLLKQQIMESELTPDVILYFRQIQQQVANDLATIKVLESSATGSAESAGQSRDEARQYASNLSEALATAKGYRDQSGASANAAAQSQQNAAASETNAKASKDSASLSEQNALLYRDSAQSAAATAADDASTLAAEQTAAKITLAVKTDADRAVDARRLYRHVSVNKAIRDAMEAREKRTHITQDAVLNWWWDIATANANEISEFRRLCCRHCWGIDNKYQWINEQEYQEESEKRTNNGKPAPLDDGGYGFDSTLDPNPDCPRCNGEGQGRAHFHDSRDLSISARRLYAGVKQGKFGLEVITRNQDDALKMVGQHLGMLKNKTEISGPDGGAISQVSYTPEDYAKAQQMLEGKLPGLD
ncbi:prophage tail fiber N-terminal domain-containing protein [Yersinia enterocolitica]|uniref:prophage tail fiber N-terminal domain-containing protein n=1 Tax=Yersinia enterocolitica TaxID=630 RepID=UPI003F4432BC